MRSEWNSLKQDMQAFDRLTYMYQNPSHAKLPGNLSNKEKLKRIRAMQEFKESCEVANQNYEKVLAQKCSGGAAAGSGDIEQ